MSYAFHRSHRPSEARRVFPGKSTSGPLMLEVRCGLCGTPSTSSTASKPCKQVHEPSSIPSPQSLTEEEQL